MVVTLSLAEAGCDGESVTPQPVEAKNPPGPAPQPEPPAQQRPPDPPPQEKPPEPPPQEKEPQEQQATANVRLQPDGTCMKFEDIECPDDPRISCNPPPPQPVPCPQSVYPEANDPSAVRVRSSGECFESFGTPDCPEGATCNPPPPRRVQCPK